MNEIKVTGRTLGFSESVRRLNPGLFALGGLRDPKREQTAAQALGENNPGIKKIRKGVEYGLIVWIISFRSRILDSDNLIAGAKSLRDSIARTLGVDDSDKNITWRYLQCDGNPRGTLVLIHYDREKKH